MYRSFWGLGFVPPQEFKAWLWWAMKLLGFQPKQAENDTSAEVDHPE